MPRPQGVTRVEPVYALSSLPPSPVDGQVVRARAATGLPAFRVAYNATSGLWEPEGVAKLAEITGAALSTGFSGIPQIFSHLRVVWMARSAAASGTNAGMRMRWNGLSGGYEWVVDGWNSTSNTQYKSGATGQTSWLVGLIPSPGANSNYVGKGWIEIPFYARSDQVKQALWQNSFIDGSSASITLHGGGSNDGTVAALTALSFFEDSATGFQAPSRATLYGIP